MQSEWEKKVSAFAFVVVIVVVVVVAVAVAAAADSKLTKTFCFCFWSLIVQVASVGSGLCAWKKRKRRKMNKWTKKLEIGRNRDERILAP